MPLNFGAVIDVLGPKVGFPGQWSRTADTIIVAHPVLATAAHPVMFGDGCVLVSPPTGGAYLSIADYLAGGGTAATLPAAFAGVAIRNVKVLQPYSSYAIMPTPTVSTTATQGTIGATTIVVASATGLALGMNVEGFGIAPNSVVTLIAGTTVTLSLPTTGALSATPVTFAAVQPWAMVGSYAQGTECEVLVRSSVTVAINAGVPQAGAPVYVRTVANPAIPGTYVGGFEAAADGTNTVLLGSASDPWMVFRTGQLSTPDNMAEILIKTRHAA